MSTKALPLSTLIADLRKSPSFLHKRDIAPVLELLRDQGTLPAGAATGVENGDDCAALNDGSDGYLLFAMEGMMDSFVEALPWFAGYSAVMVNVSDVYAMGGRPIAVIDAIWSTDAKSAAPVLAGMREAALRYGVPLVGGHTNHRASKAGLAAAILGRATRLLAASAAEAGDVLIMSVDLRGSYVEPHPFWNASTEAPAERLRGDLELLPRLAESGHCRSAKDISMAGPLPIPDGVPIERWLATFPSYGFVLSVNPGQASDVLKQFQDRGLSAGVIGTVTQGSKVTVTRGSDSIELWDFAEEPFIGARPTRAIEHEEREAMLCP